MKVLTLDPGISGMGAALWTYEGTQVDWQRLELPYAVWTYVPRGATWMDRAHDGWRWLDYIYRVHDVIETYCEWPRYFDGAVGHTATTNGDIHKLAFFIGGVARIQVHQHIGTFHIVPVNDWKGQLPKQVVIERIQNLYRKHHIPLSGISIDTHGWDAVGIGLHAKGFRFGSNR
jgi:hypothetical protein